MARVYRRSWRDRRTGEVRTAPWFSVSYLTQDGRKVDHLVRPRTTHRKIALEALHREIALGRDPAGPPFEELVGAYREYLEAHHASTLASKGAWLDWWEEEFRGRPAAAVRLADVTKRVLLLKARKLKPGTIGSYLRLLKAAYGRTLPEHELARMPVAEKSPKREVTWTADELGKVMADVPAWTRDLIGLLVLTGLRLGDALRLRWVDVHEAHLEWHQQKAGRTTAVPLSLAARRWLEGMRGGALSSKTKVQGGSPFLFPGPDGPRSRENARKYLGRARVKVGAQGKHFHDMRRTFATALHEAGVSDEQIAGLLGQKSTAVVPAYRVTRYLTLAAALERAPALLPPVLPVSETGCGIMRPNAAEAAEKQGGAEDGTGAAQLP